MYSYRTQYLTRQTVHEKCNTAAHSRNRYRCGKAISITYSEYEFVALVIQNAKCMSPIILSSVVCPALKTFSTLSHKRHDFRKKSVENKMCILIFSITFVRKISYSKMNSARYDHKCA